MMAFLFSPLGRWLAAILVSAALIAGAYFKGHSKGYAEADQRAKVAELQAALDAAYQDLASAKLVEGIARANAESNRRSAQIAEDKANEYAEELAKRGDVARCIIGDDDLKRLQHNAIGSDYAAPSRR